MLMIALWVGVAYLVTRSWWISGVIGLLTVCVLVKGSR